MSHSVTCIIDILKKLIASSRSSDSSPETDRNPKSAEVSFGAEQNNAPNVLYGSGGMYK